jgi:transcriptional regulator with XRE-family HTH domain
MNYKAIGKHIRQSRIKRNLTQVEVADKVELHPNYYARIERGDAKAHIDTIGKICKFLGLELSKMVSL